MTFTDRAGTGYPWSSAGSREPSSVANPMSTMADSSYGLVSTSCSTLPSAVNPSARYQDGAGALAHAATDVPSGWTAVCSTSPPPPSISTIALTKSAVRAASTSTIVRRCGGTLTACSTASPGPASSVTRASSADPPALAITTSPPVPSSPDAGTPGQNQLLVNPPGSGTAGIQGALIVENTGGVGVTASRPTTTSPASAPTKRIRRGSLRQFTVVTPRA